MTQDQIFFDSEGNQWFSRNKAALSNSERLNNDPVLYLVAQTDLSPQNVLEIGASNGYRLHALYSQFNCQVTAVEPSPEAIADGQARYPAVTFLRGVASALPIPEDDQFDLVIVNFVFHWIDRGTLLRSVAEVDRVLKDGGYLVVGDFYPVHPERVNYHHLPGAGVWTYKQNYADIFLSSNLYELATFLAMDHSTHKVGAQIHPNQRIQTVLLHKTLNSRYQTRTFDDQAGRR